MTRNKKVYLAFILIAVASAIYHSLPLWHFTPVQLVHSDIIPFAKRALSPGWIYIDKTIEYPVLIGVFVSIAGKIGHTIWTYYLFNCLVLTGLGLLTTKFLLKLREDKDDSILWRYWVLTPSLFLFLIYNWDMFAVTFSVIAFYLVHKKRDLWATVFLALGFISKLYPGLYLLPLLMKQETWRKRISSILIFISVVFATNIFFAVNNFRNWSYFFHFSSVRGDVYGTMWQILIPAFPPYLYNMQILNATILVLLAVCGGYLLLRYRKSNFIALCFGLTLFFIIFNKAFSPQYTIWLLPFFVLLSWPKKSWFYGLELSNAAYLFTALFYLYTPHYYSAQISSEIFGAIRFIFLAGVLIIFLKQLETKKLEVYE